ncbi:tRNA (adenosine(37)-N6)-threonylcarbamoyltransferase complex ATPase subunit type 1 TsaE [Demetria terragena]|uniref:tRNA (adenosine(37)-N6)-threonylcarbamoyltransferase complex ATPase subunit type 1 TsaE n=1 Tax=Demetria terragena TaxID=63959 RepID=UPI000365352A|nr:tRNA (adenosine(37)-N6)-threonylcarbamoyltransferase complex ATPase subunit type 1 TsaE [Demetria terragena]
MRAVEVQWQAATAAATQRIATALGRLLQPGDLLVLTGGLGAGKTTFTQGLAVGLGVRGPITSPTFVVAREHPSEVGGPPLVHVDAYRLGGADELDDLDLDAELGSAVTVVEWGAGLAEALSEDYLEILLDRDDGDAESVDPGAPDETPRTVTARGHGVRWAAAWPQVSALT